MGQICLREPNQYNISRTAQSVGDGDCVLVWRNSNVDGNKFKLSCRQTDQLSEIGNKLATECAAGDVIYVSAVGH